MRNILLTLFTLLSIASCRHSARLTENEKASIIKEVRQTLDNYCNDIRASGLHSEFKYLDNSPDFFWVPPGYSASLSYDSVAAIIRQNAPKFKSVSNSFETIKIIPLSKEIATYTGRLKSTMLDNSGNESTFWLMETGIMIKRQNKWKLLSGQTSILKQ